MILNPASRPFLVLVFAALYFVLLYFPIARLADLESLGGLPFGLAGLLVVLFRDLPDIRKVSEISRKILLAGAVASGLIYILATWMDSTGLQLIGLGLFAAVWLARFFPRAQMGGLLVLIGLICLPLGFLKGSLLLSLQQLASVMASWALDLSGVAHLRQGVILETMQGTLFVEEACSGMQSLVTGLIVSQVYFCWHKKGLIFSLAGLLCCSALLILGNCLRIFLIGWLYGDHAIDLTKGWQHEMTGLGVYLLVLALLPSLTSVLDGIGRVYLRWSAPWKERLGRGAKARAAQGVPALRSIKQLLLDEIPKPLVVVVALMAMATVAEALIFRGGEDPGAGIDLTKLPSLSKIILPAELAGWQQDPGEPEVSVIGKYTLEQRVWTFRKGALTAWVAAGLPYDELHPLRVCYINRDWVIAREGEIAPPSLSPFSYLELRSKENSRAPMLVCFDNYDLSASRFVGGPPDRVASRWETMTARLKGKRSASVLDGKGPFCQVQVVQSGVTDHKSGAGAQTMELLAAAREALAEQITLIPAN
jgi:exosortase